MGLGMIGLECIVPQAHPQLSGQKQKLTHHLIQSKELWEKK
jgi:hypothetical protein